MIEDSAIEGALAFLQKHASQAAQARADRITMENYTRTLKAELMTERKDEALGAQERYAYAHPKMAEHWKVLNTAIMEDERWRLHFSAKEALIEAWRTMCSNARATGGIR